MRNTSVTKKPNVTWESVTVREIQREMESFAEILYHAPRNISAVTTLFVLSIHCFLISPSANVI
ncbi:hypothetical protein OS493_006545 [Desmophyllum pertusum]|uniref:Uncharacterized protein n=1 Tax=Desmophyllum pertusum TaxID=174260 RepID=A0A9X0A5S9_9CNID|nr:hypothetical protein OS493_006545 [Desmophyllum pertusum]